MTPGLLLWTLAPGLVWAHWLYKRDVFEPEPIVLVIRAFVLGMLIVIPAGHLNTSAMEASWLYASDNGWIIDLKRSFLVVAPIEEGLKFATVYLFFFRHKEFDEPIDGLIYTGTVALGFASAENAYYVLRYGGDVILTRSVLAVPAHFLFAASYGHAMGMKKGIKHPREQGQLMASSRPEPTASTHQPFPNRGPALATGLVFAMFAHGSYNAILFAGQRSQETAAAFLGIFALLAALVWRWRLFVRELEDLSQYKSP